ncbi:hypothetical protein RBG61_01425 [Paludicola sp. MB14-C6]|uniref:hypothetical protein n=1 Tax=Paludihabitans sp. MB14-C6 TaxID=3070656 RepID=UPI0027DC37FD|nr:hypothetical protein [Paludicola sp. MB14-C6]WMJ23339.1 hypothetical protein RBG61_01370 [Paludicola sp. MB14-C6]WMJ23350.1 hypothetical protein RBG61_01425 [Paludicola sp. MB14-C6]
MRINIDKCYKCQCNSCSRFYCQYQNPCSVCKNLKMRYKFDCDFYENNKTKPKRYKFKKSNENRVDIYNVKLDLILAHLGLESPSIDIHGTWDMVYKDTIIGRFKTKKQATEYYEKIKCGFGNPQQIKIVKRSIDI